MTKEEFEKIVEAGVEAIPEKFLRKLDNVAVVIAERPSRSQEKELKLRKGWTLFGLYEGVSLLNRGVNYGGVIPDKITIFQKPIEEAARSVEEVKEIVKNTVWHEIAHHFGMSEAQVHESEEKRKMNKKCKS